jgi:hypothetical protein
MVGGHGVQQAGAVFPVKADLSPRGKVEPGGVLAEGFVTLRHAIESQRKYAEIAITVAPEITIPVKARVFPR